jgi:hypothetical protein
VGQAAHPTASLCPLLLLVGLLWCAQMLPPHWRKQQYLHQPSSLLLLPCFLLLLLLLLRLLLLLVQTQVLPLSLCRGRRCCCPAAGGGLPAHVPVGPEGCWRQHHCWKLLRVLCLLQARLSLLLQLLLLLLLLLLVVVVVVAAGSGPAPSDDAWQPLFAQTP